MPLKDQESIIIRNAQGFIDSENPFHVALETGMINFGYDYVSVAFPDCVTEVYTFKTGGVSGTVISTITIVYTDSTKANLSSVSRV